MTSILILSVIICIMLLLTMAWALNSNMFIVNMPSESSVVEQDADINYTKIINFWEEHKNEFVLHGEHKEVVLAMGNTGAGKTTLTLALTGQKLRSIKVDGYLVIVDEDGKIGTGASSKTLVPEIMTDIEKNVTYVDCSGFRDNREIEYEISSVYFQNILMDQIERIKLILVINYDSLKVNGNKNDFDDLFEHIGEFIKDFSKFYNGIILVATKVENIYEQNDNGTLILSNDNQSVLKGIANYLENKKKTYRSKTENTGKYKMFADLIDVLLQKENDSYKRIALFRQPTSEGLLKNLPESRNEIDTITKMTIENLHFVDKKKEDFGFALSQSSKIIIDQIVDDIFRNALMDRLHKMGNETLIYYSQIEKQYSDIGILQKRVSDAYNIISKIKNVNKLLKLFRKFLDAANTLNVPLSLNNLDIISMDIKKLDFFTTVSNNNEDLHLLLLKNVIQNVTESIENLKNFYDFLNNLQENLAAYNSQRLKGDNRIMKIITSCASSTHKTIQNITDLKNVAKEINSDEIYNKIETLELNRFQLKHLESVFSTFLSKLEFTCTSSSEKMTVKGYNIKMSDIVKIDCWTKATSIQIFALNKVFIDCSMDKTGTELQLFIIAPTWEIEGKQKIILDGKAGEPYEKASTKSAEFTSEKGKDGLPGLPGGPAGHFFGVGKQFINSEGLEISANGGKGGPGQNGGNGANGITGEELSRSYFNFYQRLNDVEAYARDHPNNRQYPYNFEVFRSELPPYIYDVFAYPKPSENPSNGGDGGAGGIGGYPSKITINGLGKLINVKTSSDSGSTGLEGQGGYGGKGTSEGRTVIFWYVDEPPWYISSRVVSSITWDNGRKIPAGKDGKPGVNKNGAQLPTNTSMASLYSAINSYKDFIRANLFKNIKESELRTFIYVLENDNQIKAQYNTLAFVKEYEGLENQFLVLRNKIDFVSFYNSFLTRVEEFAMSDKILENKKVLSYIYTAALTKVYTLKKKRKGQTVVDLSKYLNTIETSVKEIHEAQHLQIVQQYREDYKNTLNTKIREAEGFIQNKIEPEINELWEESDSQIKAIINEIKEKENSTEDALVSLEKKKEEIRNKMQWRAMLLPLKLVASSLSFFGPIGAEVGTAVTDVASIADGMIVDTTSNQGQNQIPSINPSLKLISRVTKVFNEKSQKLADKLSVVVVRLEEYVTDLLVPEPEKMKKRQIILRLKTQLQEAMSRKKDSIADVLRGQKDIEDINKQLTEFTNSEKDFLKKEEVNKKQPDDDKRNEKAIQQIKNVQTILDSVEIVFDFAKEIANDQEMINIINYQMSEYAQQLRNLETMESEVYNIVIPDLRQIEETINEIKSSVNGSSHAKLDLTKWTVRTTLKDVKSLLQRFTHRMSFDLQSNLMHYMEKIDEGFSILIDIYDRIDSYLDSVKQAEYMAHIVSTPMMNVGITNPELSNAMIVLKLIIQSNILFEKYGIALHAFKQHYFPFAAHVLQKFELPTGMRLDDTETLRSNIIEIIKDMKNFIDESESTIGEYSKYVHEKKIFNSNTTGSSPFYVWKHDTFKEEIQRLLNGSEILLKADTSKGLFYNSIKYNDIGINFKLKNKTLENEFTSMLKNFALTMTMVGNNYYRCGERYYFISFDDDITISYTLNQDEDKNWIDPNKVYTTIRSSRSFLSPYVMWSIKLKNVDKSVSFENFNIYTNETIDLELFGRGYYIEQNSDFNFEVCNEYLDTFYDVENIAKELV